MNRTTASHPHPEALAAFLQGRLEQSAQAEVEAHVAGCEECCRLLASVPDDTLIDALREGTPHPGTPRAPMADQASAPAGVKFALPTALRDHPRYRVVRVLGTGGMGVVYQAEHRLMERRVAVKVIHPHVLSHPLAVERFRREVKAAARLSHPNIVTSHDAEQAGDLHFLVMEYVEGMSLARYVQQRGPLPVPLACDYVGQAALGLQHAMEQGMVHRDIKPQNLMLTPGGVVKILDFGLARLTSQDDPVPPAENGPALPRALALTAASFMYKNADAPLAAVVRKLLTEAHARGICIVAVGQGVRVLAGMDALRDTRLALGSEQYRRLFPDHRQWSAEPVVVDNGVLSAADASAAPAMVEQLSEILSRAPPSGNGASSSGGTK